MTTKVTVDAHAGWPVKVTKISIDNDGREIEGLSEEVTVPPNQTQDFYVHSNMEIRVKEMPQGS